MTITQEANAIINSNTTQKEKIIALCRLVREIPYKRIGSLNPVNMVSKGKGSCTPKHVFLAKYLKKMNIPVKFLIIPFYYKKIPLNYPQSKKNLVNQMPISYHTAIKAKINNKWIIIDVTWDSHLRGFPVNSHWDGKSNMKLAVIAEDIIEKDADPRDFEKNIAKNYSNEEILIRKKFYNFFDTFLIESRKPIL